MFLKDQGSAAQNQQIETRPEDVVLPSTWVEPAAAAAAAAAQREALATPALCHLLKASGTSNPPRQT